jgi:DNA modification methylase
MIEMWDEVFEQQSPGIAAALSAHDGTQAFELMHEVLDGAWAEAFRVLRPGGVACINIGDATRTIDRDFRLYSNHTRMLTGLLGLGFVALPDILWRKPTNAPNKFMGSGMLPVGAYVTYEHEYILILRKGRRRDFKTPEEKAVQRQSAFFWEERNSWFSDVWVDIRGAGQGLIDQSTRKRSAAFPFDLAHRLVCMFSVKGDTILDPFSGTGTTSMAAMASGRNSIGVDLNEGLVANTQTALQALPEFANRYIRERLRSHMEFVRQRIDSGKTLKHRNENYDFEVVTGQEKELLFNDINSVTIKEGVIVAAYGETPQADLGSGWLRSAAGDTPNPTLQATLQL